jgi:isopenicillin-N epimerase
VALRDEFLLDPDVVFLNHGSFGACPRPVFETYQRWQLELERRPVEFLGRRLEGLLAEARARLAAYVGARADDLVFVPNATSALTVVARSLPLEPGDEILATDHEYGACDLLWRHVCNRAGASYVKAPVPLPVTTREEIVEAVSSRLTPRTRALFVSQVTSPTALVLPVAELCSRARAAGVLAVVDGAHGPGQLPLDLDSLGADVYAGNCHKWLCAPKGSGFLWARPEAQEWLEALVVGWGFGDDATFLTRNERQGTRDPAAFLTVPTAIEWQEANGWDEARARCRALARLARDRLAELTGTPPLAPDGLLAQMTSALLPPCDGKQLQRRLYDEHRVEVPVYEWNGQALLRASFQGYNGEDDLERLLAALARLLPDQTSAPE